jgi:hypothetical protein
MLKDYARTDGPTEKLIDTKKLIAAYCNSAKVPFNNRRNLCIRMLHFYSYGPVKDNVMSIKM